MPAAALKEPSTDELIAQHQAQSISTDDLIKAHKQEVQNARVKNTEVESALQGGVQGATLGFADELEGAARGAYDSIKNPSSGLEGLVSSYRDYRDKARGRYEQARQDNPASYTGGEVVGSIGSAFIPGVSAAKGASALGRIVAASKAGAAIGAGTSNADLTQGEIGKFAEDVGQGATTGAAIQGAMSGLGGAVQGAASRFQNIPETRAVKAVTGQNISALRQISDTTLKSAGDVNAANQRIVKVGRDILDEPGVLGPLSKVEDIAPKLSEARQKYGQLIGDVGTKIDEIVPGAVDAKSIANKIVNYAETIPETLQGQKLRDKLVEEAANFEKIGALNFGDAQKFKNQFKYKPVDSDALISNQDATNKLRNIISGEMDFTAANLAKNGTPEVQDLLGNYGLYKSKYGSFKAASDAATDRVQKNLTNRFVSPSDYGVGSLVGTAESLAHGGVGPGTIALGIGAAAANKFARERGSALAARTAEGILNAYKSEGVQGLIRLGAPVVNAAKDGNPAAIATFQILSQSNPKALEILNQQNAMQRRANQ